MKKTIVIFALWLAGVSLVHAQEIIKTPSAEDEQAVIRSTKNYLLTLDAGKYDESWMQFAPEIQKTMAKFTYTTSIKLLRSGLGDIKQRKVIGVNFIKDLEDSPPGIYAAFYINSDYQRVSGQEKVVLTPIRKPKAVTPLLRVYGANF